MTKLAQNNLIHPQTVAVPEPLTVHPSVSALAAELLMKTCEQIAKEPDSYNQQVPTRMCGSPCCITGWMEHFAGGYNIGLTREQERSLFLWFSGWPNHLQGGFDRAKDVTADFGIARIEHFLTTGQ